MRKQSIGWMAAALAKAVADSFNGTVARFRKKYFSQKP